ncbi:MAG: hypothetical protein AAF567_02230 [Actinomycetota bacterium]
MNGLERFLELDGELVSEQVHDHEVARARRFEWGLLAKEVLALVIVVVIVIIRQRWFV